MGRTLAMAGYAVFMVDHQGHGLSDGERMFAHHIDHLAEDSLEFVQHVLRLPGSLTTLKHPVDDDLDAHADVDWKTLPRFVLGHSIGGVLALRLMELSRKQGIEWNGVVLSSAAIYCFKPAKYKLGERALSLFGRVFPSFAMPVLDFYDVSHEREVLRRKLRDPIGMNASSIELHWALGLFLCASP
ncbi:TPA: hypothetical protein N0F65_007723 [Lagenidium giganteum]|uniref:Serine aminopeptidase S33 domain-containing protein n=1 Tax=Lagenidium giganteum TaxID=4803 RepID=A0AAV2Z3G0_9STRA|nr:TPA: hypothetical protein N0F65_007723 [Lagenidium giganteum]